MMLFVVILAIIAIVAIVLVMYVVWSKAHSHTNQKSSQASMPSRSFGQPTYQNAPAVNKPAKKAEKASPTVSQAREYDEKASRAIAASATAIRRAETLAAIEVATVYLEQQERIAAESRRLEEELQRHLNSRLQQANFSHYEQLHGQSKELADYRYDLYNEARKELDSIGQVIVSVGKGEVSVDRASKKALYDAKDAIKAIRDAHLTNTRLLNNQTHAFKLKLRDECGEEGRMLYEKIERATARRRAHGA